MQRLRAVLFLVGSGLLGGGERGLAETYTDTKKRFTFDLADGWEPAPRFGETRGMNFSKRIGSFSADFSVRVQASRARTPEDFVWDIEQSLRSRPSFRRVEKKQQAIGTTEGWLVRFEYSKDSQLVRTQYFVFPAFGHLYVLRSECEFASAGLVEKDVRRMSDSFVPREGEMGADAAGRSAKFLPGRWQSPESGFVLVLGSNGSFVLDDVAGRYQATRTGLMLEKSSGARSEFKYALSQAGETLTLTSDALELPLIYKRIRGRMPEPAKVLPKRSRADPLLEAGSISEILVGYWETRAEKNSVRLELFPDGVFSLEQTKGVWSVGLLKLHLKKSETEELTYDYSLAGDRMILRGADLDGPLVLWRTSS